MEPDTNPTQPADDTTAPAPDEQLEESSLEAALEDGGEIHGIDQTS